MFFSIALFIVASSFCWSETTCIFDHKECLTFPPCRNPFCKCFLFFFFFLFPLPFSHPPSPFPLSFILTKFQLLFPYLNCPRLGKP